MADEEREAAAKVEGKEKPEEKAEEKNEQPEKEMMRSIVLTGYGGYDKLQVQKLTKPKPANGQVVVRVHAW